VFVRVSKTRGAHGWRSITSRADRIRARTARFHPSPAAGMSIRSTTSLISSAITSTMPSSTTSLLATW